MWVYIQSESFTDDDGKKYKTFTVGFYQPDGCWFSESDHNSRDDAAKRVNYLNGGAGNAEPGGGLGR